MSECVSLIPTPPSFSRWDTLVSLVGDDVWPGLRAPNQRALASERAVYEERRGAPNKIKPYPPFSQLFGVLSAAVVLDAFKRQFAARLVSSLLPCLSSPRVSPPDPAL